MADGEGETEMGPKERAEKTGEDSPFALDSLLKNLRELEAELRQQDVSVTSSGDYCSSFCEVNTVRGMSELMILLRYTRRKKY